MKKKLLIVAKSLGGGGSEVALIEFLNHLDLEKYSPELLLLDRDTEYKYRLKRNVPIHYINFDKRIYYKLASMYSIPGKIIKKSHVNNFFDIYAILAKHANKFKTNYDIAIDFYGYGSFTTAYLALNINAKKKAFWLHDQQMPWIVNVERYFKYYDAIFGVSKAIKKTFDTRYPNQIAKSKVLYNTLDIDAIKEKAKAFIPGEFSSSVFNILTVGRLTEQKGHDISIKAARILKDKDINYKWYIIGEGRDKNKLRKLIIKNKLENQVILLGRKDNPYPYIKNCDLFVLPSRHEGYSVALLEARILKKLIVTSNFPANTEQIKNNKNGLVSNLTPQDLARQIFYIYSDKKLRQRLYTNMQEETINFDEELLKLENI